MPPTAPGAALNLNRELVLRPCKVEPPLPIWMKPVLTHHSVCQAVRPNVQGELIL